MTEVLFNVEGMLMDNDIVGRLGCEPTQPKRMANILQKFIFKYSYMFFYYDYNFFKKCVCYGSM